MFEKELLDFGFTEDNYKKIRSNRGVVGLTEEKACNNFYRIADFLSEEGYTKEEIIKMLSNRPMLISFSIDTIKNKKNCFLSFGYEEKDIHKMFKKAPEIFTLGIESVDDKINELIKIGYTKEEVIKMSKMSPIIFSYSIDSIKKRIDDLMSLNYTKEEVLKITKTFPDIYGLTIENIREKINFYDSIDMHLLPVVNPKYMMQSVALSYARYQFYLSKGYSVDMGNYKDLFIGEKQFRRTYGTTKEEILEKYNYNEYLKNKKLVKE